jgi:hypothetical protein
MPRKTRLNKHLTSKLQVSPNFTPNSVADSNYRGKCDVGGFLNGLTIAFLITNHINYIIYITYFFNLFY